MNRPRPGAQRPLRLRARIVTLVTSLALLGFITISGAGWLIVLEAEDRILDAFVSATVPADRSGAPGQAPPPWLREFASAEELQTATGLESVPAAPGWHEIFASERDLRAIAMATWSDRWRAWLTPGLEREFRLYVPPTTAAQTYRLIDLAPFEFTEPRVSGILRAVVLLAAAVAVVALLVGLMITRWTLRPVIALTDRVRDAAPVPAASHFAAGMADDEIGFLARALDDARAREAGAWVREQRFIADCSHELRTPVATLKSAVALWPDIEAEPEARAQVMGRIARAVNRTEQLVRFFLVLAREEREPAETGWVALDAVVADLVAELEDQTLGSSPTWRRQLPPEARVQASRDVVVCILRNLMDNALKHARPGQILIAWKGNGVLCIEDDGPGFPELRPADAPPLASSTAGYGMGWNLVERLCRVQGWSVSRSTSALGGARVDVTFSSSGGHQQRSPCSGAPTG
jgi:signal transduction histidine kinase